MKKLIFITMSIFNLTFGAQAQQIDAYKILDAQIFKDSIATKNIQLIDVRTPDEYKSGHIKNAKNIDFYSSDFNVEFNKLDKEKPVYIYCRSGSRSRQSANKLADMGFKIIYDLKGGILNYN
jgi:rhodanese-related sulfurtransferase